MKEIIIYDSLSGNTEELENKKKKEKPSAKLEKITTETVSQNDEIYYIGTPIIKGMCTDKIKKILMSLENKKIFLFVTAGYGGALKQLSIGCASSAGKTLIHTAGKVSDQNELFNNLPEQDRFLEAMADAASSVVKHFNGNAAYINIMKNISVDCDCDGNASAPCMQDIGILASLDPIAIDQACLDLVYNSTDPGKDKLIKRIESLHGVHTVEAATDLGFGTREYELINLD